MGYDSALMPPTSRIPERPPGARPAAAAALLLALACGGGPGRAEREIEALVGEALQAVRAGDAARLDRLYLHDPRYERDPRRLPGDGAPESRVRLADFCSTPGFDYDPPSLNVALLRNRAVVTFELCYRFTRGGEVVARQARVALFVEGRPNGWGILRDSVTFPSEPQPQPPG